MAYCSHLGSKTAYDKLASAVAHNLDAALKWNVAVNGLVARHLTWSDFEVEAKLKNIASERLAQHVERAGALAE